MTELSWEFLKAEIARALRAQFGEERADQYMKALPVLVPLIPAMKDRYQVDLEEDPCRSHSIYSVVSDLRTKNSRG